MFELANPDLGLWVLELEYTRGAAVADQVAEITKHLLASIDQLERIKKGSNDFTLHLTLELDENTPLVIPPNLSKMISEYGISIEAYNNQNEEG
ncbi:hypothetical protein [Luteolibacter sp. AS25]|uniref:hypothetical protein n=1 Tax=Luteolibacter sp. AS25 TaxID=3135776 RepID=UPI00398A985B